MTLEDTPGELLSTMNPSTFLLSWFLAQTIRKSRFPLPIHLLVPLSRYPSPFFATDVYRFDASEPIFSSVSAQPPIFSSLIILGIYSSFCFSLPSVSIVYPSNTPINSTKVETPASPRASYANMSPRPVEEIGYP